MGFYFSTNNKVDKLEEEAVFTRNRKRTEFILGLWFITVCVYYCADIFFNYFDFYYLHIFSDLGNPKNKDDN